MHKPSQEEISEVLRSHKLWLEGKPEGKRADFSGQDLSSANLHYANLRSANLRYANLGYANLRFANLRFANLRYANLSFANLDCAKYSKYTRFPAPTMMLLANWGEVSDDLCRDLMRFDAANHPEPQKFNDWANNGECPYANVAYGRAATFNQNKDLWAPSLLDLPPSRPIELVERLLKEKCCQEQ